jgi:hypothetical protein
VKALYFNCFSGISGDMTLGALLDLGIDKEVFKSELKKLDLDGYTIEVKKQCKKSIMGTNVNVIIEEVSKEHCERNLHAIEKIIDASGLSEWVKSKSREVFKEVARAEGKVHGKPMDQVHFHEVGAIDSIVDIVGSVICLELLGMEKIHVSKIHDGSGFIKCQHGMIPVPVPAVIELLTGTNIPFVTEDVKTEMVTPTGMALVKCLGTTFGKTPEMTIEKVGYGFGKRETGRLNALRVVMGEVL